MNLHAGDSVLAVDQHPESGHPLIERNCRIFHYSPDLDGKLLLALVAEPNPPRLEKRVLGLATTGTGDVAVRPAIAHGIVEGLLRIGEVRDGFLQGFELLNHEKIIH